MNLDIKKFVRKLEPLPLLQFLEKSSYWDDIDNTLIAKNYDILCDFSDKCRDENLKEMIDIFTELFNITCDSSEKNVNSRFKLEVDIGEQILSKTDKDTFIPNVSAISSDFIVELDSYEDKPQFIIKDMTNGDTNVILTIYLDKIKSVYIGTNNYAGTNNHIIWDIRYITTDDNFEYRLYIRYLHGFRLSTY